MELSDFEAQILSILVQLARIYVESINASEKRWNFIEFQKVYAAFGTCFVNLLNSALFTTFIILVQVDLSYFHQY